MHRIFIVLGCIAWIGAFFVACQGPDRPAIAAQRPSADDKPAPPADERAPELAAH
jgi:hypothetical protein